jgi:hypothetical protein
MVKWIPRKKTEWRLKSTGDLVDVYAEFHGEKELGLARGKVVNADRYRYVWKDGRDRDVENPIEIVGKLRGPHRNRNVALLVGGGIAAGAAFVEMVTRAVT